MKCVQLALQYFQWKPDMRHPEVSLPIMSSMLKSSRSKMPHAWLMLGSPCDIVTNS